jgi:two-component system nitrogen regulation response regulator NtrX
MSRSVLVVDDEGSIRQSLKGALNDEGFRVTLAGSVTEALEQVRQSRPDVVLLDIWMPGVDGLEGLKQIRTEVPDQIVIMMSGHGNIETAVRATKLGAFDFIEKPLSLERLLVLLQNATGMAELARENQALRLQVQKSQSFIAESPTMRAIQEKIRRVAPTTGSVLLTGENGTGKEVVAQQIHALSVRFNKPFVEVNCAAIPEELIESELFGHERGAFTGATQLRRGKFDLAHKGTLFLDEIGDMSLKTQAKILRILQEQKFERVGGSQTISVDVRIVAATNKDLKFEIQKGLFREDLFYRLNVIPFHLPPLRERKQDIAPLVSHFMKELSSLHGRKARAVHPQAFEVFTSYPWPGNVRELRNLIERMVILTPESEEGYDITPAVVLDHLNDERLSGVFSAGSEPEYAPLPPASVREASTEGVNTARNLRDARSDFEREYILRTLKEHQWNISRSAQVLGIERSHLHRKMKAFGIEQTTPGADSSEGSDL